MPCSLADAGLTGFSGSILLSRHFGMPRSHSPQEHYWLVFEPRGASMEVALNGRLLQRFKGCAPCSVEVTGSLQERNLLELTLQARTDQDGLTGETALEIRCPAYLQNIRIERDSACRLRATVEIAGEVSEGLELYLVAERRTVAYQRVERAGPQTLQLESSEVIALATTQATLSLVHGAEVWFEMQSTVV
jgi:hypothetical protein